MKEKEWMELGTAGDVGVRAPVDDGVRAAGGERSAVAGEADVTIPGDDGERAFGGVGSAAAVNDRKNMEAKEEPDRRRYISELAPLREALVLPQPLKKRGNRVHILALGDVGATLLLGLKVLGGGLIDTIGIYDVDEKVMARYEMEMNQIGWPRRYEDGVAAGGAGSVAPGSDNLVASGDAGSETPDIDDVRAAGRKNLGELGAPEVVCLTENQLFDCDLFVFCASKAVPALGVKGDVRMMQFEVNRQIAAHYGQRAAEADFQGIFAVVSDPVDPLCKAVLLASGLKPGQVRGYGLGVMNKRAEYYAARDPALKSYLTEGRAFGPHGADLVIANSIEDYDDRLSRELTRRTVEANLQVRQLGFKPYFAPALSSGAMSLILTLAGEWNYSSVYLGRGSTGAFLGVRNRIVNLPAVDEISGSTTGGANGPAAIETNGPTVGTTNKPAVDGANEPAAGRGETEERATGRGVLPGGEPGRASAEFEDLPLPPQLYERIEVAYKNLCQIL